ncbi:ran guanine nucleotide release factor-like isoform X2 [Hydractinia symbiolongicarpus]|uniref:ran guanine nucleotide release factor-like isoform X2 n=1 Tax=Hydractinia symbiolongicarpus TaxID=13093 RepID=UPI00254B859F|nr:ran guanine nucleotide release factor-like isoform X2 [Hydractinia symbiolongicarpus]
MEIDSNEGGKTKELFGGAFSCFLPRNAQDMSVIRDVPDNQEVFCHQSTDQSIMVDILEFQSSVTGENAARYHFEDLASSNDAHGENEVLHIEALSKDDITLDSCQDAWLLSGRQMVSKFNETKNAKNLVHIHMVLYRLPQYVTDIVVIMNIPVAIR